MSSWSHLNPVIAGSAAGIVSTLVVHPLDTIRTRLQTSSSSRFTGAIDCARKTIASEGVRALYKGMSFPLCAQAVYKSVMFTSYNAAQSTLRSLKPVRAAVPGAPAPALTLPELALCGAIAGGANSFIVTPVELVRNRLMVQYAATSPSAPAPAPGAPAPTTYRGPVDAVRTIVRTGGLSSLWRGLSVTLLRDMPGVGAFYAANDAAKRGLASAAPSLPSSAVNILAGAAAGIGFWSVALPLDTVKSIVQTAHGRESVSSLVRGLLREKGIAGLYRGWTVAFTRGIPSAATVFFTFDAVNQWLVKQEKQADARAAAAKH